jgi:ATP-dependent Clp protease ATP-binding subunit ClpA
MNASPSIHLVIQLAGQYASSADFNEIEPDHLLEALLKFSEIDVPEAEKLIAQHPDAQVVTSDIERLRKELQRLALDSAQVRRKLRAALGKGNCPQADGQMHRSKASRDVFDVAVELARKNSRSHLAATDLLNALLGSPTEAMKKVLGERDPSKAMKRGRYSLLDKRGKLLNGKEFDPDGTWRKHTAEGKALIRALSMKNCRCAILVGDEVEAVRGAVIHLAESINQGQCPEGLKKSLIYEFTGMRPQGKDAAKVRESLGQLITEASAEQVILFLPPIDETSDVATAKLWLEQLRESVTTCAVQCVVRVSPWAYENWIQKDRGWRSFAQVIWMQEARKSQVPREI